ncbi:MAG: hypothetical protein ABJE95_08260 [Byssovorax sp.]
MNGRRHSALSVASALIAVLLVAPSALGAAPEAAALDLAKKAISVDYLDTRFPDAEKKLRQALTLCEPEAACSDKVRARLHAALGVVYVGGMGKRDEGKAELVEALKKDPTVSLDADLVSPEIEAAFAEAKRNPGAASPGPSAPTPTSPVPSGPPASPTGSGDLVHTPPAEQATLTPVPLYVELPKGIVAARVQAFYKPFGSPAWKSIELRRVGAGWGAEIPCLDVGSATGTLGYYLQAFDAEKNLLSWSGTRAVPDTVPIRSSIEGEAPHLPGEQAPLRCPDPGDCPPEFPGCHGAKVDAPPPCEPGAACPSEAPPKSYTSWISLSVQQDLLALSSDKATCAGDNDYVCFNEAGTYYSGIPYARSGDEVRGGLRLATTRILVGYDRAIGSFTVGARLGFAFGGGPKAEGGRAFLPLHAEGRVAYWFGHDPFGRSGPKPYLVVSGGLAQVDGRVSVVAYETEKAYVADQRTTFDAWRKAGTGFVGGGVGMLYAVTPRQGPVAEVKFVEMLGKSAPTLSLSLGYAVGF